MIYKDIIKKYNIDISKLARDYILNPLEKITVNTPTGFSYTKPLKADLEYLYIIKNINKQDISLFFGVSESSVSRWLKYYNIRKPRKLVYQHQKRNLLDKFGVENQFQLNIVKEKTKVTNLKRYGVDNISKLDSIKEKKLNTCLKNNGYAFYISSKEYQDKIVGFLNPTYSSIPKEVYNLIKDCKSLKQYIVDNKLCNPSHLAYKLNISKTTCYNLVNNYSLWDVFIKKQSAPEEYLIQLIKQYHTVITNIRTIISPFEIDIYVPKLNLGIEFNGNYWHSLKEPNYHMNKSLLGYEQGIFIYNVWEYEWRNKQKREQEISNILKLLNNEYDYKTEEEMVIDIGKESLLMYQKQGYEIVDFLPPSEHYISKKYKTYNNGYAKIKKNIY